MIEIVGIGFVQAGKIYYFDPKGKKFEYGEKVVVETARGLEMGTIKIGNREVEEDKIIVPLKPIERKANENDMAAYEANQSKKDEAMRICYEKIEKRKLDMKLIDVEYTIDNTKVVFYFSAEGRIDFRDLVKDLAAHFRMRIELRQIGVRDEAKLLGGIGPCGRPLCCHQWLPEFQPVSIKMAKQQNLSLNPAKISGICGRLMCCLQYENETYIELKKNMPVVDDRITTPEGLAKVVSVDIFAGKVSARMLEKDKKTGEESFSNEQKIFMKDEINKIEKKRQRKKNDLDDVDYETRKEIEELTKD